MGIDATRKLPEEGFTRDWPAVIEMDEATKRRVDAMWEGLGIGRVAGGERRAENETVPVDDTAARVAGR
jgi:hypothetical protein